MKVVNIMNFARANEPRYPDVHKKLSQITKEQLDLVNEMGVPATFLLQYDVLCDENYVKIIKDRAGENIELGFWYEVVEPLTTACGMPYDSKRGWKWDWFINPGFSMAYEPQARRILIDEAMRKFKEIFGYYPRTVGSWMLDTLTVNYLAENYEIDAFCFCRDQINTDAYTFVGGYFNQAYYPSKNNMFTPASTSEAQINVPIFRLLGSDPIHNYDGGKYASEGHDRGPYTMELVYDKTSGGNPKIVDWYLNSYFATEDLGFSYMQIGQENSFGMFDLISPLRMQIEKVQKLDGVKIEKMSETGKWFKENFTSTPTTAVCALNNWDSVDCQSVYYDSAYYTANIFRHENKTFIRALYLFDERVEDIYNTKKCKTFDAVYENLPIVDSVYQAGAKNGGTGIILDTEAEAFAAEKTGENELTVFWNDKKVVFCEKYIKLYNCKLDFAYSMPNTKIDVLSDKILFEYKCNKYALNIEGAKVDFAHGHIYIFGECITLIPSTI